MNQKNPLTWFITGCSSGFGRELTKVVLARGYRAAVTARSTSQVEDLVAGREDRSLALQLDVTDPEQVAESVRHAEQHFGGLQDRCGHTVSVPLSCTLKKRQEDGP
jgi:NAD(P)-dependent dehydrogenase (short-subunit alcohol dehydrogenase family)